jgi:hypothetical protein
MLKCDPLKGKCMKKMFAIFVLFFGSVTFLFAEDLVVEAEKFIYDSKGKRTPFFHVNAALQGTIITTVAGANAVDKLKQMGITITAILWDAKNPNILVGDDILSLGQTIPAHDNVIIRKIEKDYVIFEVDGEMVEMQP